MTGEILTSEPAPMASEPEDLSPAELALLRRLFGDVRVLIDRMAVGSLQCLIVDGTASVGSADLAATGHDRAAVPLAMIEAAIAAGHLEVTGEPDRYRLSGHGKATLRKARAFAMPGAGADAPPPPVACVPLSPPPPPPEPGFNEAESPLGWLRRRVDRDGKPMLSGEQYEAGERLRRDLWQAGQTPRTTQSWSGIAHSSRTPRAAPGGSSAMTDRRVAAGQRVNRALQAVGAELGSLLIDVCGHLMGLEQVEQRRGWPRRSGKVMLQTALSGLARHYGLLPEVEMLRDGDGRIRHWGDEDYRPTLDRWRESGG